MMSVNRWSRRRFLTTAACALGAATATPKRGGVLRLRECFGLIASEVVL